MQTPKPKYRLRITMWSLPRGYVVVESIILVVLDVQVDQGMGNHRASPGIGPWHSDIR